MNTRTRQFTVGRAAGLTGAAVVVAALAAGCIFSPRDPDGAPDNSSSDWQTPITTEIVLTNLRSALIGENLADYASCFEDDYRHFVDPADSLAAGQEAEDMFANWTKTDEEHAASGIFAEAAAINVVFTNVEPPDESQDDTWRRDNYTMTITWESGPHVNEQIIYKGRATLYMRRTASRWAIYRWVDRRTDEQYTTWGALRGEYRN